MSFRMGIFSKSSPSSPKIASMGTAALGGAQISLTIIDKLMDCAPLPFVKGAAGAAVEVIKMARAIQSNRKECDELINRSVSLLIVILGSLKGKTDNEIPDDLRKAVERIAINFREVLTELRVVDKRAGKNSLTGPLRAVVYHYDNAESLKDCYAKLDWAMQEFQVTSKVDSCLKELEHHQEVIGGQAGLKEGQEGLLAEMRVGQAELRRGQSDILDAVKEKAVTDTLSSLPSTCMPPIRKIFGRDDYVAAAVKLLLRESTARLAILGPGGMGKTSAALKVVHHADVVDRFRENIHWVPCEQATSVPLFIELLAKSLHLLPTSSNDRLGDIAGILKASGDRHLFLIDNFETPWDIPARQSAVADILSLIGSIPTVSLVLTMRGTKYPAPDSVEWSTPRLPILTQLELAAAREAFLRIAPDVAGDPELDSLLKELDCMPLAITLMAKLASQREPPSELLVQWNTEKTGLLTQVDGDRRNSIEVSIKLSLESSAVKVSAEAVSLLSVLAVLPAGACITRLPVICPSVPMPNWKKALRILHSAALVFYNQDRTLVQVLSPIRSYMLLHHPLSTTSLHELQTAYYQLAERGKTAPGHTDFNTNMKELVQEEANVEAILLGMLDSAGEMKEKALQAALNYSEYCFWTRCQTTIIRAAVNAARASGSHFLPWCLRLLGRILMQKARYSEAIAALEEARAHFITQGHHLGATSCLQSLGDVLRLQSRYDEARTALEEAKAAFIVMGDQPGAVAQCLRSLGDILRLQGSDDEAMASLEEARASFIILENQFGTAQCQQTLAKILYTQGRYDEAMTEMQGARARFIALGHQTAAAQCRRSLAKILYTQERFDEAQIEVEGARAMLSTMGDQKGVTQCLQSIGDILMKQRRYDEAKSVLEEARATFIALGTRLGATQCLQSLGDMLMMQEMYDDAKAALAEARDQYIALRDERAAAQCQNALKVCP